MASFSEGLLLGEKVGLDPDVLVQNEQYLITVEIYMLTLLTVYKEVLSRVLIRLLSLYEMTILQVVSQGAISAPMYSIKGPSMIQSLYPTAFPLKHQQKDLRLALGLAESVSQSTPIAAAANELYKVAKSHGLSDQDFSAVIGALKSKFQHSETK
ncbi:hypothetical protein V8G54_027694 [Vigna mungo]|uniref:3-hydroxyisobutyrate dehydrogenase-like NAD-binding domain-containing protein n=1 Tax=Vigna mungo TaxID=3915 RepID=A0AAQ3N346_VIGMU